MVRSHQGDARGGGGFPHTRGDGPSPWVMPTTGRLFSPHAWGWSGQGQFAREGQPVFPTRVGMVRPIRAIIIAPPCFPHTRGDGPAACNVSRFFMMFSPHAWGWSVIGRIGCVCGGVFPTRVGMVRRAWGNLARGWSFPHTRGDGPLSFGHSTFDVVFSPHAWGWSEKERRPRCVASVFPTRVGMVRPRGGADYYWHRFPHTRGDGPMKYNISDAGEAFSPHAWGWSDYPQTRYQLHRRRIFPQRQLRSFHQSPPHPDRSSRTPLIDSRTRKVSSAGLHSRFLPFAFAGRDC